MGKSASPTQTLNTNLKGLGSHESLYPQFHNHNRMRTVDSVELMRNSDQKLRLALSHQIAASKDFAKAIQTIKVSDGETAEVMSIGSIGSLNQLYDPNLTRFSQVNLSTELQTERRKPVRPQSSIPGSTRKHLLNSTGTLSPVLNLLSPRRPPQEQTATNTGIKSSYNPSIHL